MDSSAPYSHRQYRPFQALTPPQIQQAPMQPSLGQQMGAMAPGVTNWLKQIQQPQALQQNPSGPQSILPSGSGMLTAPQLQQTPSWLQPLMGYLHQFPGLFGQ